MVFDDWRNVILVAFFVVLRSCKDVLKPMFDALHYNIHNLHKTLLIIVDNAQAEIINTLKYVHLCYTFCGMHFVIHILYHLHCAMHLVLWIPCHASMLCNMYYAFYVMQDVLCTK